jgi:hypothetical protein
MSDWGIRLMMAGTRYVELRMERAKIGNVQWCRTGEARQVINDQK